MQTQGEKGFRYLNLNPKACILCGNVKRVDMNARK